MTNTDTDAVRCSAWARAEQLDPIGSAGSNRGFLLIDLPLPWPRDVGDIPEVGALKDQLTPRGIRPQAMVPQGRDRRVVLYSRTDESSFCGFTARQTDVADDLSAAVGLLLSGGGDPTNRRDLLICTHGKRDVCCGSKGTELSMNLDRGNLPAEVVVSRTSHTGGHRFAPTFMVLPEGTAWAFADADLVERVLNRRGEFAEVADHYRGCSGLDGSPVQALEREVLSQVGWEVLDRPRQGSVVRADPGANVVRLVVEGTGVWEGIAGPGRTMKIPDCMRPLGEARKSETEWAISGVTRI